MALKAREQEEPDNDEEEKIPRRMWKFWLVVLLINLGFGAVMFRLFIVQIVDADKYQATAKQQHESKVTLRAERGNIYDRNGKLIAGTIQSVSIAVDPLLIREKEQDNDKYKEKAKEQKKKDEVAKVCEVLEKYTKTPRQEIMQKIYSSNNSFLWLARGLLPEEAAELNYIHSRWLIKIQEPRRHFLYDKIGAQIVGITNIDNRGVSGVEASYDSLLSGTSGYMIMQRDGKGRLHPSADLPAVPAVHGLSLELTLDIELQRIAEYELEQGILKTGAETGTIIAINPKTGEILAMASYPSFNPNNTYALASGSMKNRAFMDVYEPGSTFKTFIAAAALEEKLIAPYTMVDGHNGELDLGFFKVKDDHAIGKVPFHIALEQSSNIVFSTLGNSIPDKKFFKYLRDFGFGTTLGLDVNGENSGKLKKPSEFNQNTKRYMGFGYGLQSTPLQTATAISAIANKGVMMKPHLVKRVMNDAGECIKEIEAQKIRKVISEKTANTLTQMLCGVVEEGTGTQTKIQGVKVAGKTGTTKQVVNGAYSNESYMASFAGFFPADNPKIAMIVTLDKPKGNYYGGSTAAPIFREVAMRMMAVTPEIAPSNLSRTVKKKADTVITPNVRGMLIADADTILKAYGFKVKRLQKEGIVIYQQPAPGTLILEGKEITLSSDRDGNKTDSTTTKDKNPDVTGLSLRRAISILHNSGIKTKVQGSGKVKRQEWFRSKEGELWCKIICD